MGVKTTPSREHNLKEHGSRWRCERCGNQYNSRERALIFPCMAEEDGTTGFVSAGEL